MARTVFRIPVLVIDNNSSLAVGTKITRFLRNRAKMTSVQRENKHWESGGHTQVFNLSPRSVHWSSLGRDLVSALQFKLSEKLVPVNLASGAAALLKFGRQLSF